MSIVANNERCYQMIATTSIGSLHRGERYLTYFRSSLRRGERYLTYFRSSLRRGERYLTYFSKIGGKFKVESSKLKV